MKSIVITPKNSSEFEFLNKLLKKLNISSKVLTREDKEDIGMAVLMRETDRTKKVSRETIMKSCEI